MEWGELTDDQLDEIIVECEAGVARLRAAEMAAIAEKRNRSSHLQDGYRSIIDWIAARADVAHRTARRMCWTATRLEEAPDVAESLANGDLTFDRAEQVARLPEQARADHRDSTSPSCVARSLTTVASAGSGRSNPPSATSSSKRPSTS